MNHNNAYDEWKGSYSNVSYDDCLNLAQIWKELHSGGHDRNDNNVDDGNSSREQL